MLRSYQRPFLLRKLYRVHRLNLWGSEQKRPSIAVIGGLADIWASQANTTAPSILMNLLCDNFEGVLPLNVIPEYIFVEDIFGQDVPTQLVTSGLDIELIDTGGVEDCYIYRDNDPLAFVFTDDAQTEMYCYRDA